MSHPLAARRRTRDVPRSLVYLVGAGALAAGLGPGAAAAQSNAIATVCANLGGGLPALRGLVGDATSTLGGVVGGATGQAGGGGLVGTVGGLANTVAGAVGGLPIGAIVGGGSLVSVGSQGCTTGGSTTPGGGPINNSNNVNVAIGGNTFRGTLNADGSVALTTGDVQLRNEIEAGSVGLVRFDQSTGTVTVAQAKGGDAVAIAGTGGDRRLTGLAGGRGANDAATISQLASAELRLTTIVDAMPVRANNASGLPAPSAGGADALAVGYGSSAAGANAVAIGAGARADQANAVAIGAGAATTRANQVAIGTGRSTYTFAGLASAESAAAQKGPTRFVTTDAAGNLATSPYGPDSIAGLEGRVGEVQRFATEARREARQGIASAMAMTSASMPSAAGRTSWVMNTATFRGEWAAGGALAHRLDTAVPLAITAGYAYGGGSSHGVRVGLGGEF